MHPLDLAALTAAAEPGAAALLAALPDITADGGAAGVQALAAEQLAAAPPAELPPGVSLEVAPDGTRVLVPDTARADVAVLWIHGGGLIAGAPEQDDLLCARIALEHGVLVRATPYRLAPQAPYPAGLDDCVTALKAALAQSPSVVVAGASAGGGLAIATALRARDEGMEGVRGVVAYYPMLDDRPGRQSMERVTVRKTWHAELDRLAWAAYLPGTAEVPFYAAPARATTAQLRGLPPVYLDVGTLDGFLDEDLAFAAALARADVPVDLTVVPRAWHASENVAPGDPSSQRLARSRSSAFARVLADG